VRLTKSIFKFIKRKVNRRFEKLEQKFARYQGKGFVEDDPSNEVALVRQLIGSRLKLGVDVGGNRGDYSAALRRLSADMEIHIFEPSVTNIHKLTERFGSDKKISVIPKALSDSEGSATLHSDVPGSGLGSLIKRRLDHFNIGFEVRESIETVRFENYWKTQLNSRPLDLIKLDIEGHELKALDGMGEALRFTKAVQFEFGGCNVDTRTFFQDFWYFFTDQSFMIYRMSPFGLVNIERYSEIQEFFSTTNYLCLNRNWPGSE